MKGRGFTLVELLVVIAVILILAAILFPVFAQAKEAAKKTTCLSNQKQSGVAVSLYLEDFDDVFPQIYPQVSPAPWDSLVAGPDPYADPDGDLFSLLKPFTKAEPGRQVNHCPSDLTTQSPSHPNSYIPNGFLCFGTSGTSLARPADTVFASESGDQNNDRSTHPWLIFLSDGTIDPDALKELGEDTASRRHAGRANYVFSDWHVKSLPFAATYAPRSLYDPR